jgi:plasmid stabilization system protein ParE
VSSFDVEILPEAEAQAREAFLWYFDRSPIVADAFRIDLFDAIDGLSDTARDWPEDEAGIRRSHFKHFPYSVTYEVLGRTATVFAIAHQRRRPGYWKNR